MTLNAFIAALDWTLVKTDFTLRCHNKVFQWGIKWAKHNVPPWPFILAYLPGSVQDHKGSHQGHLMMETIHLFCNKHSDRVKQKWMLNSCIFFNPTSCDIRELHFHGNFLSKTKGIFINVLKPLSSAEWAQASQYHKSCARCEHILKKEMIAHMF